MADKEQLQEEVVVTEENTDVSTPVVSNTPKKKVKDSKKVDKKGKKKDKTERVKKRRIKETVSELKKVTWPKFSEVAKKTGIVLAVVLIFGIILLGMDYGLGALFGLL